MVQADILRIDLAPDEEVLVALAIWAERRPELEFAALVRQLIVAEADRIVGV